MLWKWAPVEYNKTAHISYEFIIKSSSLLETPDENVLRNELMMFAEHIGRKNIRLSIGPFVINYSLLFIVFVLVISSLGFLLQF